MKRTNFLILPSMLVLSIFSLPALSDAQIAELQKKIETLEEHDRQKTKQIEELSKQKAFQSKLLAGFASTLENAKDRFAINGFMSMGMATIDEDNVEYGRTTLNGGGGPDFNADAYIGLQMDFILNEATEVTTQFTSKGITQDAQIDAEWFYLNYRYDDNLAIQIGRLRVPFYMLSEYKEVGFAYPWVRPPLEIYDAIPVDKTHGIKLDYRNYYNEYEFNIQLLYSSVMERGKVSDFDAERFRGINVSVGQEEWSVGLSSFKGHVSIKLTDSNAIALTTGLATASGVLGVETPVFIDPYDEMVTFSDVYFSWDNGTWQLLAEAQRAKYEGFFADFDSYYASIGRRIGKWNPYFVLIDQHTTDNDTRDNIVAMLAPLMSLSSSVARLSAGIDAMSFESRSYIVGLGYEITPRIRTKFEMQLVTDMNDTLGPFKLIKENPGPIGDDIWIYSFVVDTVF